MYTKISSHESYVLANLLALAFALGVPRALAGLCIDHWRKVVGSKSRQQDWTSHNALLRTVQVGAGRIRDSSDGSFTLMKPSSPDGRRPMHNVKVAAQHACDFTRVPPNAQLTHPPQRTSRAAPYLEMRAVIRARRGERQTINLQCSSNSLNSKITP